MGAALAIDMELRAGILSAFGSGSPAGTDLRLDTAPQSLYFRLRDARSQARAAERAADADPQAGCGDPVHWHTVRTLAIEALQRRTKDIEVAVWLAESLTRHDGLPGLTEAATILAELIERFWDDGLFPAPDETDPEGRLIAVSGLSGVERDGSLLQPLRKIILFHLDDGIPLRFWEYERSREIAAQASSADAPKATASTVPDLKAIETAANGSGQAELRQIGRDVSDAVAAWTHMEAVLAGVAPADAMPSTGRVSAVLDSLRQVVDRHVRIEPVAVEAASPPETAPEAASADQARIASRSEAVTREQLLDQVVALGRAFRRLEPNSPISYTLEEAVRRANLSWPDLMRELVPEVSARANILLGVGLKRPDE